MPCKNPRDSHVGRDGGVSGRHQFAGDIGVLQRDLGIKTLVIHYVSRVTYSQKAFGKKQNVCLLEIFFLILILF